MAVADLFMEPFVDYVYTSYVSTGILNNAGLFTHAIPHFHETFSPSG